jgi:N utilization substance protein A
MQSQFFAAINQLCDEKNISRDKVLETVKAALRAAYRKDYGHKEENVDVAIDENSGLATVYIIKKVVKELKMKEWKFPRKMLINMTRKLKSTMK